MFNRIVWYRLRKNSLVSVTETILFLREEPKIRISYRVLVSGGLNLQYLCRPTCEHDSRSPWITVSTRFSRVSYIIFVYYNNIFLKYN